MTEFICPECGCEGAHYCTGKKIPLISPSVWINKKDKQECLHKSCDECGGTGRKKSDGTTCVHYISCPCERCTPRF